MDTQEKLDILLRLAHVQDYWAVAVGPAWVKQITSLVPGPALENHLAGRASIGVYTTRKSDNTCKWVCWDVDTRSTAPVYQILAAIPDGSVTIEDTGGRGWHVWRVFTEPVLARIARTWALGVVAKAGLADNPLIEVYPKQERLAPGAVGNLLRLPFGSRLSGKRSTLLYGNFSEVEPPADGSQPISTYGSVISHPHPVGAEPQARWISELFAGSTDTFRGRNNTLWRLANWLQLRGFPQDVTELVVREANRRQAQPLDEAELVKIVRERNE